MTKAKQDFLTRVTIILTIISLGLGNLKQFLDVADLKDDKEQLGNVLIISDSLNYVQAQENAALKKLNVKLSLELQRCLAREAILKLNKENRTAEERYTPVRSKEKNYFIAAGRVVYSIITFKWLRDKT